MDPIPHEDEPKVDKGQTGTYEAATGSDIYGPEFDLHTSQIGKTCSKHPGHKGFIPIKEFTIDHLPEDCPQKDTYFALLKLLANLVVHISALNVSTERPLNFPLFKDKGGCKLRQGSGFVRDLFLFGQSGQGAKVVADEIEEFLDQCKFADLAVGTFSSVHNCFSFPSPFLYCLCCCVEKWLIQNLQDSGGVQCRDNFTRDLIHEIEASQNSQNCDKADTIDEGRTGLTTTLNDFRKARGMDVSDFCMALARGLKREDVYREFWERHGPYVDKPCPCCECRQSGNPKKTWWMVKVATTAHFIFDHQEGDGAEVSLYYDDDGSQKVSMRGINVRNDWCDASKRKQDDGYCFVCSLHDGDAGEKLKFEAEGLLFMRDISAALCPSDHPETISAPTAVIAHPHGSFKHISIGTGWEPSEGSEDKNYYKIHHTAATCPGSSGGAVLRLSSMVWTHSKAKDIDLGVCGFVTNFFPAFVF